MASVRRPVRARIAAVEHEGHGAVEIETRSLRLVVVTDVGPRIAWFGKRGGANLLYWDRAEANRRGAFVLRGGHRLWITRPGADEAEETYAADNAPCRVDLGEASVDVTAPPDALGIEKSLRIRVAGDSELVIEHRLRNRGDMLWSGGAWALSCTRPRRGDSYGIPLGSDDEWDAFSVVIPRRWGGTHTSLVDDRQLLWREHALVVRPRGRECKRMIEAPRGIIGMTSAEEGVTFVKRAAWREENGYPLGTNIAFYIGPKNFMVEMETMSPVRQLKPGASVSHVEEWQLRRPTIDWTDEKAVARLWRPVTTRRAAV